MNNIALISCVSQKEIYRTMAENMYTSSLFIKSLKYVKSILKPHKIYILSAKYGLLKLDEEIEPYNETLNGKTKQQKIDWSNIILQQLKKNCNINEDRFIFLAGRNYYEYLTPYLPNKIILMENLPIGKRLQWLNGELNERLL